MRSSYRSARSAAFFPVTLFIGLMLAPLASVICPLLQAQSVPHAPIIRSPKTGEMLRADRRSPRPQAGPADTSLPQAAAPQFSVAAGSYSSAQSVTITDSTPGATIYYSTNGAYPYLSDAAKYTGSPIMVSASEILVAVAIADGYSRSPFATAEYIITSVPSRFTYVIAGNDTWGNSGDGGPGPAAKIGNPSGVVADKSGTVYFADIGDNVVRRIDGKTGLITTIAGTGDPTDTGDGGPGVNATVWWPQYLALDGSGHLYISEEGDNVVRMLDLTSGTITRFAGGGTGTNGASGPALNLSFGSILGIFTDQAGSVFIGDENSRIYKVDPASGNASFYMGFMNPAGFPFMGTFAVDFEDNVYALEAGYGVIDKIDPRGTVTVFAGSKTGYPPLGSGDGGPATSARIGYFSYLATDSEGNLYISDSTSSAVREVDVKTGIINTIAGVYAAGPTTGGNGDPSTSTGFYYPENLSVDGNGNVYLCQPSSVTLYKITAPALPPTAPAASPAFSIAGGAYPNAQKLEITSATPGAAIYVTFDGSTPRNYGQGYHGPINLTGSANLKAFAVAPGFLKSAVVSQSYTINAPPDAIISTVAGSGVYGSSGTGGAATSARLGAPTDVAFDSAGNSYIVDAANNQVWKVAAGSGTISIVAGNGTHGFTGDGSAATSAELNQPLAVAVDKADNLYIADYSNNRIRMVAAATGIITTVVGGGTISGNRGDGGPATSAYLSGPQGIAFDSAGNLLIADRGDARIRQVDAKTGIISTIGGTGSAGGNASLGDGGLATAASIVPTQIALDGKDNIYVVDPFYERIRRIDAVTGIITTVVGGGKIGSDADGTAATDFWMLIPYGVAVDAAGNLFFSELARVLKVDATTGTVATVAGNTYYQYSGDGGEASIASLAGPEQLTLDSDGNLYIPDSGDSVVRKVVFPAPAAAPVPSVAGGSYTSVQQVSLTDSTPNAAIYYTLDGSTPDTGSTAYSGPITVRESETLQAVAAAKNYALSPVAEASYTITLQTPTIALTTSAASAFTSNSVTFTATMTATSGTPSGTITFMDGTTNLGTGTLSAGVATYSTSSLTTGTHTITAVYGGDNSFNGVTSAALTETIEDFTFAPPSGGSTSATVSPGGTATYKMTVTPPSGATTDSAITFTVSGLPSGATSSFSPATVPANSGATDVTLSITVPAQSAAAHDSSIRFPLALGLLVLPLLGLRRNLRGAKRIWLIVMLAVAATTAITVAGCGGGSSGGSSGGGGSQSQTYNLTVTATAGSLTHTTKLTLTVQ